jgi:hypothetical protein
MNSSAMVPKVSALANAPVIRSSLRTCEGSKPSSSLLWTSSARSRALVKGTSDSCPPPTASACRRSDRRRATALSRWGICEVGARDRRQLLELVGGLGVSNRNLRERHARLTVGRAKPTGSRYQQSYQQFCRLPANVGERPRTNARPKMLIFQGLESVGEGRQTRVWCPGEDSNLHGFHHWYLKPARLPIPPPGPGASLTGPARVLSMRDRERSIVFRDRWRGRRVCDLRRPVQSRAV